MAKASAISKPLASEHSAAHWLSSLRVGKLLDRDLQIENATANLHGDVIERG